VDNLYIIQKLLIFVRRITLNSKKMNIKETFLSLTTRTYPHGTEVDLFPLLPQDLDMDDFGNLYKQIGDKPSTMFACHLDTATSARTNINHVFEGDIIKTDGTSILGADDKAGVAIILNMIENKIPGLYYFFLGEEVGCLGSKKVAEVHKATPLENIKKVISFDRRGTTSIITHQCSARCCSDEFGTALGEALNKAGLEVYGNDTVLAYKNDPTGLYTDSAQFTKIYPECTNISVGYQSEHTFNEQQNIKHLEKLAEAVLLVDWESLPISRDPSKVEYSYSGYGGWGGWDDDYYYNSGSRYTGGTTTTPARITNYDENIWVIDEEYENYVSCVTVNKASKRVTKTDLSKGRINYEVELIGQLLMSLDIHYDTLLWDGFKIKVQYSEKSGGHTTECDRNDLSEYMPELDFWKEIEEKEAKRLASSKVKGYSADNYPLNYD
jgi:hypothetical protein